MSLAGNIKEILDQIQRLMSLYGDVTFRDMQRLIQIDRKRIKELHS